MRKLTTVLVTGLMIAGLATSALAAPGWSNHPRNDYRFKQEQRYQKYDHRDYRQAYRQPVIVQRVLVHPRNDYRFKHEQRYQKYDHRDHRRAYRQPVIVHRVPVNPPRRYARVYQPVPPGFGFFFPHLNIQIR